MEKIKQKLLLRSSNRNAYTNEDCDRNANSKGVRGSTYSGSTLTGRQTRGSTYSGSILTEWQTMEQSGPWGLKELYSGTDPIVE